MLENFKKKSILVSKKQLFKIDVNEERSIYIDGELTPPSPPKLFKLLERF